MNDNNNKCKDINLLEQELIFKIIIIILARYSIQLKILIMNYIFHLKNKIIFLDEIKITK